MTLRPEDDDTDLRDAFAALREADAAQAPPFRVPRAEGRAPRGHRLVPWLGGLLAAAGLAAVLLPRARPLPGPAPTPPAASLERWTAPTDFLLRTPGREILETVPRFGERWPKQRSLTP
jgi:hypothetical protein